MFGIFRRIILLSAAAAFIWWLFKRPDEQSTPQTGEKEILVPPVPVPTAATEAQAPQPTDDLTRISGIQLAAMNEGEIRQVLEGSGIRITNPESWPEKASLAANE